MSDNQEKGINLDRFLDDYFAECDDHLTAVRRNLLALESFVNQPQVDRNFLDRLFRSFHTLKGLAGMVSLLPAEELAHQMEHYLRALRQGQVRLTSEGLTVLMDGTTMLEQVIAAKRSRSPLPAIASMMERLEPFTVLSAPESASGPENGPSDRLPQGLEKEKKEPFSGPLKNGERVWVFEFRPSLELSERGINVNTIRSRLEETGRLVKGDPKVLNDGGISFEFLLVTPAEETGFNPWQEDGLSWRLFEGAPPEAARSPKEGTQLPSSPGLLSVAPFNVIRVDLGRLEDLMQMVGGLVISRARLEGQLKELEKALPAFNWQDMQETSQTMERQLRDLREGVMQIRMVPIGDVFNRMQFVIHDLARESQKKIRLELVGQETEIDKVVVERMLDPLLHLVRNAISHGLETPEERREAGKSEEGKILLKASTAGDVVVIQVEDDGRGLDREKVLQRAVEMDLIQGEVLPDMVTLLDILCEPGFSTRKEADLGSGRGVGMGVVKNMVQELGGSLSMDFGSRKGMRFTIELPLTLAIVDALIVKAGEQTFAVPQPSVREVIEVPVDAITLLENNEIFSYRGGVLPLLRLSRFFHLEEEKRPIYIALVVGQGLGSLGIMFDRILSRREIVVRAVNDPLVQVMGISGATELGDGRAVLILDVAGLLRAGRKKRI